MPTTTVNIDGFTCTIHVMNTGDPGYLPIIFTANSVVGKFPGDRQLQLLITPQRNGNTPTPETTYTCSVLLPAGQAATSVPFYLPKYFAGGHLSLSVSDMEGPMAGYRIETQSDYGQLASSGYTKGEIAPRMAIILPDVADPRQQAWQRVPDLRSLDATIYPDPRFINADDPGRLSDDEALDQLRLRSSHASQLMRLSETHTEWLGYESTDIVLIPFPLLEKMRQQSPECYAALRDWIGCGGVLWTYGIGDPANLGRFSWRSRHGGRQHRNHRRIRAC